MSVTIDISNQASWQVACQDWDTYKDPTKEYIITGPFTLDFSVLNTLPDKERRMINFSATLQGNNKIITLDSNGATDISQSLFMNLSGGIIKNLAINLNNLNSNSNIKSFLVGKTNQNIIDYATMQNIRINNTTNSTVSEECSFLLPFAFGVNIENKTINISSCRYTGPLLNKNTSGLFGKSFCRDAVNCTININNCSCTSEKVVKNCGGLFGQNCFTLVDNCNINIDGCSIIIVFIQEYSGGLFGPSSFNDLLDNNTIKITNCVIKGNETNGLNLDRTNSGGMFGSQFLYNSKGSKNVIDICDNTINIRLRNNYVGGMFGNNPFDQCENQIVNIKHNTINIDFSLSDKIRGGLCCFNNSYNNDNTNGIININNNTINYDDEISNSNFGGLINVDSGLNLSNVSGKGEINITNNNLSGISLTPTPIVKAEKNSTTGAGSIEKHVSDLPQKYKFLFNTDGIPYFDDSINDKIFETININSNIYGLIIYEPLSRDFSTLDYMLQHIYKKSLLSLNEQTWFDAYELYLTKVKASR